MKKLKILALTTIITLIIFIVGAAVFAYLGVFSFNLGEEGGIGGIVLNPAESEKENILRWQTQKTFGDTVVNIKTSEGSFSIKLADCAAAEKFAEIARSENFSLGEFKTLAENMFIQASVPGESFAPEENEMGCFHGSVGFVKDGENASPSFFIITAEKLSGLSESYISKEDFDENRAEYYRDFGGIPEYEGKAVIFGQVISGMEIIEKIAAKENLGYTGGYSAEEPVKIISAEIIYPSEPEITD